MRPSARRWPNGMPIRHSVFAQAAADADRNYRLGAIPLTTYTQIQQSYVEAVNAVLDTRREALEALLQLRALNGGAALAR